MKNAIINNKTSRMMDTTGLNLPAIKKGGALEKAQPKKSISTLDLSKKTAVSSVMKTETASIQKEILQSEKGLDLVLVGDLTGSMANYHKLLKNKFAELCGELFPLIKNLRIGIIFYLDHEHKTDFRYGGGYTTRIQKLVTNTEELVSFIQATNTATGGYSNDEAVEDALNDLLNNMNWKEPNSRSVVIFGDANPHPAHQCPSHYDFFDTTRKLYDKGVTINSVYCSSRYRQSDLQRLQNTNVGDFETRFTCSEPAGFFSWIANVTGGMVLGVEKIEDLVDIIMASAAKDSGSLDELEKKIKATEPAKLKLIEIARKAEQRKQLGNKNLKMLKQ